MEVLAGVDTLTDRHGPALKLTFRPGAIPLFLPSSCSKVLPSLHPSPTVTTRNRADAQKGGHGAEMERGGTRPRRGYKLHLKQRPPAARAKPTVCSFGRPRGFLNVAPRFASLPQHTSPSPRGRTPKVPLPSHLHGHPHQVSPTSSCKEHHTPPAPRPRPNGKRGRKTPC